MAATKILNWVVYVLKCPRTREIRYVGWTALGVETRLRKHVNEALRRPQYTHKCKWIMSLVSIGLSPEVEVIETGTGDGWGEAERRWIAHYRAIGARLVNGTEGGDGVPGWGTPEQRRERIRKANATMTPEQRSERTRKAQAGMTPEQRSERVRKANAARTPEQRSAAARKATAGMSPEQRSAGGRKASAVMIAQLTPEQRSQKGRKARAAQTPEQRSEIARKANATRAARRGLAHSALQVPWLPGISPASM